jgi:class 3 adenylate cyclase
VTRPVSSPGRALPTGTVTFLFTDIEGSTRLLRALGERYAEVLDGHHRLVREAIAGGGGTEVGTEGDSFFAAFHALSRSRMSGISVSATKRPPNRPKCPRSSGPER